eukprot:TRINITY_DN1219_c0_g1_i14.p1 TRINITY_DN1219_c0_g1~~TRINITY_DN1219_c0_g1_i14.p1  ORF type:complete len:127 (+),score=25.39 TRINITY_DN1219_c0_g1_i14:250-630(+)
MQIGRGRAFLILAVYGVLSLCIIVIGVLLCLMRSKIQEEQRKYDKVIRKGKLSIKRIIAITDKDTYEQLIRDSLEGKNTGEIAIAKEGRRSLLGDSKDLEVAIAAITNAKDPSTSQFNSSSFPHYP